MLPYGTGSKDLQHIHVSRRSHEFSWKQIAVGATFAAVGLGYCASLHSLMAQQNAALASIQQQMSASLSSDAVDLSSTRGKPTKTSNPVVTQLPHKFAVDNVTPRKTQDLRGTCWDFATISVLEYTYRQQGIANGWLAPDTYVSLSEQAYGADLLRLCTTSDKSKCYLTATQNTTEGGYVEELLYLNRDISIFPDALCPYIPGPKSDTVCPGLTPEAKKKNPLMVTVNKLTEHIDSIDIKKALVTDRRAMALSTTMAVVTHYWPCVGELTKDPRCDVSSPQCTLCPPNTFQTACCIPVKDGEDYNMDGEFIAHYGMEAEGGHAMTIVGYNDLYRTKDGATGGYILKNSWWDGVDPALGPKHARGSHSIKYWLQEITAFEERFACPNSANPNNWYTCQGTVGVIQQHVFTGESPTKVMTKVAVNATGDMCLSNLTRLDAESQLSPLRLQCLDSSRCDPSLTYFTRNISLVGDQFNVICLFEYNPAGTSHDVCLPPLLIADIAHTVQPVKEELRENDPDICGFYFYPYDKQLANYQRGWEMTVDNLDVTWAPQSYAANAKKFPHLDYSLVLESTKKQNHTPATMFFAVVKNNK
ncbi:hypothetical protein AeMF1_007303 [Aphanomyces euteiches]|nr:hypothetical protein AeMF1_007303 [Aphanomyces euteiches]KAH9181855.1 hypothetical protein AeNC1_016169 [Aphanomyces euteiches]